MKDIKEGELVRLKLDDDWLKMLTEYEDLADNAELLATCRKLFDNGVRQIPGVVTEVYYGEPDGHYCVRFVTLGEVDVAQTDIERVI